MSSLWHPNDLLVPFNGLDPQPDKAMIDDFLREAKAMGVQVTITDDGQLVQAVAALKPLGQKVDALSWTHSQRSACWALWRA
jgi:hypothetical protein